MTFIKKYKLEIAIVALALVVRCLYLGMSVEAWGGDFNGAIGGSDYYIQISDNILAGHGFSIVSSPPYELNSFRTPGMPYFLVLAHKVFGGYLGVVLLQILLASLLPLLAMRLVRFIVDTRWIAVATGVFIALEPYTILFSTIFYSETIFTFIFFISLIYFFKYLEDKRVLHLIFSGAFMGFAMLTKPTIEFLPLFLAVFLIWHWRSDVKREALHVAFFLMTCALVVSPWIYRNYLVTGSTALSPQTGVNLYVTLWPSVLAIQNGTSFGVEFAKLIATGVKGPNIATVKESAEYTRIAVPLLLHNPVPLAIVSGNTVIGFFTHDGFYDVLRHLKIRPDYNLGGPALFMALKDPGTFIKNIIYFVQTPFVLILIGRIFWIVITGLFLFGTVRYLWLERRPAGTVAIIIVTYFMLTTLIVGLAVNARYRFPVNVFIVAFALYAAVPLIEKLKSRPSILEVG